MNYNHYCYLILAFILLLGCKPEARRPIMATSSNTVQQSILFNQQLNKKEEELIRQYILKDTLQTFANSNNGFWYANTSLKKNKEKTPKTNDIVIFALQVEDLKGTIFYHFNELGELQYKVDKQDIIKGLQDGLKLMNEGDTFTFLFPSYKAYGHIGDEKKIGRSQPLICKVKLIKINKNESN